MLKRWSVLFGLLAVLVAPGTSRASPEGEAAAALRDIKEMFFADDLESMVSAAIRPDAAAVERFKKAFPGVQLLNPPDGGATEDPWDLLRAAVSRKRAGNKAGARAALREALKVLSEESRMVLLIWSGLRSLGEAPPQAIAEQVLGVVVEVPQDIGVDTLAAYADGRARYINCGGGMTFWESIDDPRTRLVHEVTKAAQQVLATVPRVARRKPYDGQKARITLLTPGGLHVQEGTLESIAASRLGSTLWSATKLLWMLTADAVTRLKK